jgi:hypothetical protein
MNPTYLKPLFVRLPERTATHRQVVAQDRERTAARFVREVLHQVLDSTQKQRA